MHQNLIATLGATAAIALRASTYANPCLDAPVALRRLQVLALLAYGTEALNAIPGLRLIGTAREKASVLSFVMEGIHPHDIGTLLDRQGIAVRTGHHCAQPVMDFFNVPATTRASLAFYNTFGEIDALVAGLKKVKEVFA